MNRNKVVLINIWIKLQNNIKINIKEYKLKNERNLVY